MRSLVTCILLLAGQTPAAALAGEWDFRVLLDGREIGRHQFTLQPVGEQLEIRSVAEFDVRFLFLSALRYSHEAVERWDGDCLQSLESRTETNGKRTAVSAAARDGRLAVQRGADRGEYAGCVMSFAYWNPRILEADRLLNSQTGELVPVVVTPQGRERLEVRGRPLIAERHRIRGPGLSIDVWYADGEWVGLEAPAKGGRTLRYELDSGPNTS